MKKLFLVLLMTSLLIMNVKINHHKVLASEKEYIIYPIPQNITYNDNQIILNKAINAVISDNIDNFTIERLRETLALKNLSFTRFNQIKENNINIIVATNKEDDSAYNLIKNDYQFDQALFEKIDAYKLIIKDDKIIVVGKDSDAAFYGLTSLYHILNQSPDLSIRNLEIEDYADIVTRGFIEGYYGNPWSIDDRVDLMTFGGYYKQNAYFYAPKDDPKHRVQWDVLYTEEELQNIERLALAGNKSKTRYIYAIHPFPYGNDFKFDNRYDASLSKLKAKLSQVISKGVRQIAILADDFVRPSGPNSLRLINDVTNWLKDEVKVQYPDMKLTLPWVPFDYYNDGTAQEFQSLKNAPENVQLVMTGGKIWGEVSHSFTSRFKRNVGRGPFLWINWPCSDNSKNHLILGGSEIFLHTDVDPNNIEGLMLNPMQQSEASKVAIFQAAAYAWNIYDDENVRRQVEDDTFAFVDHNSPIKTTGSIAYASLAEHMKNQNMPLSKVRPIQESIELAPKIQALKQAITNGNVDINKVDELIEEFNGLLQASLAYERHTGNTRTYTQIKYWIDSFKDTANAAIAYLKALKHEQNKDINSLLDEYSAARNHYNQSRTYSFHYVDHLEYAEVGVQHIVPMIRFLDEYLANRVEVAVNPDANIKTFITSRSDAPTGVVSSVFDGNLQSGITFKNPNTIKANEYVGVKFEKDETIRTIRFYLGASVDHFDSAKLQYLDSNNVWQNMDNMGFENHFTASANQTQDVYVELTNPIVSKGIRLVNQNELANRWLEVREIAINQAKEAETVQIAGNISVSGIGSRNNTNVSILNDGDLRNEVFFAKDPYRVNGRNQDFIDVNDAIILNFNQPKTLAKVEFHQGISNANDVIRNAKLQYQLNGSDTWVDMGVVNNAKIQTFKIRPVENVAKVRIINQEKINYWWRVAEFRAFETAEESLNYTIIKPNSWTVTQRTSESALTDGDDNSFVWYDTGRDDHYNVNDALTLDLGEVKALSEIKLIVGASGGDKFIQYAVEYSNDNNTYTAFEGLDAYTGRNSGTDTHLIKVNNLEARYLRVRSLHRRHSWVKFSEFSAKLASGVVGTDEYIDKNIDAEVLGEKEYGYVTINSGEYTLGPNQYIGLDLKNIKDVTILKEYDNPNIQLKKSLNTITWDNELTGDARYIRLENTSNSPQVLNLRNLKVSFKDIKPISIQAQIGKASNDRDVRSLKNVDNAFDNNLNTYIELTGSQTQGQEIIFDLGRDIDFASLRYYIDENNKDFLRSADFFVLNKINQEWVKVLAIDPETVENTHNEDIAKNYDQLTHDTKNPGFMYKEARDLSVSGSKIKIVPTKTYSHRWIKINELQINDGAYLSKEVNRDILFEGIEKPNLIPTNAIDHNYKSVFAIDSTNGQFDYRVSIPNVHSFRIVSLSDNPNAEVKVITSDNEEITLGKLNQAINEFALDASKQITNIKVSYQDKVLEINEIRLSSDVKTDVNKVNLQAQLERELPTNLNRKDVEKYNALKAVATAIKDNQYVTQAVVDNITNALKNLYDNARARVDVSALENIVNNKLSNIVDDVEIYTKESFAEYMNLINLITLNLENSENLTADDVNELVNEHQNVVASLKYSNVQKQLASFEVEINEDLVDAENYSRASYHNFQQALNNLKAKLDQENVSPVEVKNLRNLLTQTKNGLIDISSIKTLNEQNFDAELYTDDSYQELLKAKQLITSAIADALDNQQVLDAKQAMNIAIENLEFKSDAALEELINEIESLNADNYTTDSFKALNDYLAQIEEVEDKNQALSTLKALKDALVNISALKNSISQVEAKDLSLYTNSSKQNLLNLIANKDALLRSATTNEVETTINNINSAILNLKLKVSAENNNYLASLNLISNHNYTSESYDAYLSLYNQIKNLDVEDTTNDAFELLKARLNEAIVNLKTVPVINDVVKELNFNENGVKVNVKGEIADNFNLQIVKDVKLNEAEQRSLDALNLDGDKTYYRVVYTGDLPTKAVFTLSFPTLENKEIYRIVHIQSSNLETEVFEKDAISYKDDVATITTVSLSPFIVYSKDKTITNTTTIVNTISTSNVNTTINNTPKLPNTGANNNYQNLALVMFIIGAYLLKKKY